MDPNEALNMIKAERDRFLDHYNEDQEVALHAAYDLVMALDDLDQWISNGGFLPTAWRPQEDHGPPDLLPDPTKLGM